jgi:UDP-3-O-[3-hydroxymyristoyl] glucosamine N-acyltransferase
MSYTVSQIAEALGATVLGDGSVRVTRPAEPAAAGPDDLALAMDPRYGDGLASCEARAAIVWDGADWRGYGLEAAIIVPRPRYALAALTRMLDAGPAIAPGRHPTAFIDPEASIGPEAAIGPFVAVGAGARIGARARISAHVLIDAGVTIGDDATIGPGVRIMAGVRIGARFIAQPNAVIGGDGFSFVTPEKSGVERARESLGDQGAITAQSWTRIHSLGGVVIGDDVEIGACTCIDAGTIRATVVGSGTKIDDLVMIAHNVEVGRDCLFAGQVGIAGSTRIGDRVVFGGQVGVADNIFVGDDVIAGGATKILSNAPAGRVMLGYPGQKMETFLEGARNVRRLGRLMARVAELQKSVPKRDDGD